VHHVAPKAETPFRSRGSYPRLDRRPGLRVDFTLVSIIYIL
jgi:hypothetical protein